MAIELEPGILIQQTEEGLDRLIRLTCRQTWSAATDVDWQAPLPPLSGSERDALVQLLSLIYWSDRSGQSSLALMADHLERRFWVRGTYEPTEVSLKVQTFLRLQREDEVRHADALARLIGLLGASPLSPGAGHARVLRALAAGADYDEKLVIIHWLVELYARLLFEQLHERFAGTLIAELFTRILVDERRHLAFGDCYLPLRLQELSLVERAGWWRAQVEHLGGMAWEAITGSYVRAARVLELDVRAFYLTGLELMEARHQRLGAPLVPLNLSPLMRPLAAWLP